MESLQGERTISTLICTRKQKKRPFSADQAFSKASCNSPHALSEERAIHCHPQWCTHPPPPVPLFLLAQNLSSKRIAPTDNMRPNFDDDYSCHL